MDKPPDKVHAASGTSDEQPRVKENKPQPDPSETVGPITDKEEKPDSEEPSITNTDEPAEPVTSEKAMEPSEASKDHNDDGGEVVEGEEDTVIY